MQGGDVGTIVGRVTDVAGGAPLAAVSLQVDGTRLGAITSGDGNFRIAGVPAGQHAVTARRIGYQPLTRPVTVAAGGTATLDLALQVSATSLTALVVTGTLGPAERVSQPAVIASVDAADIQSKAPVSDISQLLGGRVPGANVVAPNSASGTAPRTYVRGPSTISLANVPIVFIDGVRVDAAPRSLIGVGGQQQNPLSNINPDDIESVEVVKGPAAATLYGAEASSGVIQIITKKGRNGVRQLSQTLSVDVNGSSPGFDPPSTYGVCSAALTAPTSTAVLCKGQAPGTVVSTNVLKRDRAYIDGTGSKFNYSIRGGGENYGYFGSAGASNERGTTRNNSLTRQNGLANFNWTATPHLLIDAGVGLSLTDNQLPGGDQGNSSYMLNAMGSPTTVTQNADGTFSGGLRTASTPTDYLATVIADYYTIKSSPHIRISFSPLSWFTHRLTAGADIDQTTAKLFTPINPLASGTAGAGSVNDVSSGRTLYTIDYAGKVQQTFGARGQISSDFTAGAQYTKQTVNVLTTLGQGLLTNSNNLAGLAASTAISGEQYTDQRSLGLIVQENLGFSDRLYVQAGVRFDKNSSFGSKAPTFVLPKVGFSYVISKESFWQNLSSAVPTLRLRAAYGTSGRSPVPGASLTTFSSAPYIGSGGAILPGLSPLNAGNPNLKPERGTELEYGFDASFFGERANLEFTVFDKETTDLLLQVPQPPSLGFASGQPGYPFANAGHVSNKGVEASLRATPVDRRNVAWEVTVNASTLQNKLVSLGDVQPFGNLTTVFKPGLPLGAMATYHYRSVDVAANRAVMSDTVEYDGTILPKFDGAFGSTVTLFQNLRLYGLLTSKVGFKVYDFTDYFRDFTAVNSAKRLLPEDQGGYTALERTRLFGTHVFETSGATFLPANPNEYVRAGDFLRLQELSASLTLPASIARRLRAGGMTLTAGGRNLALWTKYKGPFKGADPETSSFGATGNVAQILLIDVFGTPAPRQWFTRLNVQF
jgi:TonB-linked SusC/RagA family outer membrane protein